MKPSAVLAFSGGLDTTFCAVWLREQGYDVHTVTVQTGGFDADELAAIERRSATLGAAAHQAVDGRKELFDDHLRYLIFGNVLRGDAYPLCVSVERLVQARLVAEYAARVGAQAVAHGSTGAGNDQVRFDAAFRLLAPRAQLLAPIRELALSREDESAYLAERGVNVPLKTTRYSVNRGLWGATIGGGETHRSDGLLPEEAYVLTSPSSQWPVAPQDLTIAFQRGVPAGLDGQPLAPVALIERLTGLAGRHGVGRGMHVGDTIIGLKGRVAFEAPAAVTLITAHRELEKLVLSRQQSFWKRTLGDLYGSMVHEARYFDPLLDDLQAFLASSQQRVTGEVRVRLQRGQALVLGANSPHSLMNERRAAYGEGSALWSGAEAAAFSKLYVMQDLLLAAAQPSEGGTGAPVG